LTSFSFDCKVLVLDFRLVILSPLNKRLFNKILIIYDAYDAVTNQDYLQDPQSWCGGSSLNEVVLNPNVAHDLEVLRQHWKGNVDTGSRLYTDEEEIAISVNYLKNRSAASEEPFTEVVSKSKKKKMQKGFQVHNTRSKGRLPY